VGCAIPLTFTRPGQTVVGIISAHGPTVVDHTAHFTNESVSTFGAITSAVGTRLALLTLGTPASGITFALAGGIPTAETRSTGPILTERGTTIGKHKVFVGFSYQHFRFDTVDGVGLRSFPAAFSHSDCCPPATAGNSPGVPAFENDVVLTTNRIDLKLDQFTSFVTYGVTDRFDVSIAVPIVNARIRSSSVANLDFLGSGFQFHFFPNGTSTDLFSRTGDAKGIGDLTFRAKGSVWKGERAAVALGLDVRVPTGDEKNFLGAGAAGVKPFVALSYDAGRFSPHVNFGYQWNGDSILGGDITTGTEGKLPNQLFYAFGADVAVVKRVTLAFDFLGQRVFDSPRVFVAPFIDNVGGSHSDIPQLFSTRDDFNMNDAGLGVKFNPVGSLLISGNVLWRLNNSGLRAKTVPLVGISYTF
jgi:hypothetical protein